MVNLFTVGLFGWIGDIMQNLLTSLHSFTGSYGLAIILLTFIIRLVLFPLVSKQTRSMKKMQELQPMMQELQKKYENDKEKLQQETMKLYQENKVNPAAGCLPLLIQMPILIALFRALRGWEDLVGESFLLIPDLSKSYFPLVILTGLIMLGQSLLTQRMSGNDQNNKMALLMPLMIVFIGAKLPAGVLLYWFTSNLMMTIQQYFLYKESDEKVEVEEESS